MKFGIDARWCVRREDHAHLCHNTFALNYLLNGGDMFTLREILGHTTFKMVNHYLTFSRAQLTAQHHQFSPMDKLHKGQTMKNVAVTAKKVGKCC